MSERNSTRAGSRRTTSQPAPHIARVGTQSPSKGIGRKTRSQSRDIGDSEDGRTGLNPRKGVKQATPDGANATVIQTGSKSRKRRPANDPRVQQDLSTVAEDPSAVYPNLEITEENGPGEEVGDGGAAEFPITQHDKSPESLSAFSGTTARISFPTQEPTELNLEDILDTLPDLSDTSDKLLSFAIPAELSEALVATTMAHLQNKDTREYKKLKRLGDTFERQRKEYGGDSYINVGDTLKRLLGRKASPIDEQTASWRPDALLQKANLAVLVLQILSIGKQDQREIFTEDIAGTFPLPFLQSLGLSRNLTPECSALAQETCELALEVRTQEAIMLLARHVGKINFDPDTALLQVFYDDPKTLKGWATSGLRVGDLTEEAKERIVGRVKQLRGAFISNGPMPPSGQPSGVDSLHLRFPWSTFAPQMLVWVGHRVTEIENRTANYGGAQSVCQGLTDMVQSGMLGQSFETDDGESPSDGPELRLDFDAQSESHATSEQQGALDIPARAKKLNLGQFSAVSTKGRTAAAHLKRRKAERELAKASMETLPQNHETHSFVQVASTAGPSMLALTPQPIQIDEVSHSPATANVPNTQAPSTDQTDNLTPEDNGERERDIVIRRHGSRSLLFRKQREAESNKENVVAIPELQQIRTAKKLNIYDRNPLAERVSPIDSQDLDQHDREVAESSDEGFQEQAGSSHAEMRRRLKPATKRPAPEPARLERRSPKNVRIQENVDVHTLSNRDDVPRNEQEVEPPLSQAFDEYQRVRESAKQRGAVVTKPPQSRKGWTSLETEMLHYLITEHGTSWKRLKDEDMKQDYVLEARDQVALKDKARNMKIDYLKAGRVLPRNFERVPLSQMHIKKLRDGGIEYDSQTGTRVDAEVVD